MSGDVDPDLHALRTEFHSFRKEMSQYMHQQNELMKEVVTVQARQEESSRSTRKLFEICDELTKAVHKLEVTAAGGTVKIASNERIGWLLITLLVGAAVKTFGGV